MSLPLRRPCATLGGHGRRSLVVLERLVRLLVVGWEKEWDAKAFDDYATNLSCIDTSIRTQRCRSRFLIESWFWWLIKDGVEFLLDNLLYLICGVSCMRCEWGVLFAIIFSHHEESFKWCPGFVDVGFLSPFFTVTVEHACALDVVICPAH